MIETTTQAVDTAATDLRKDVENDIKTKAPIVEAGLWASIKKITAYVWSLITKAYALIRSKL